MVNDPLYNHPVFGPARGRGGDFGGKPEDQLVAELLEVQLAFSGKLLASSCPS